MRRFTPEPNAEQAAALGSDESSQQIDRIVDKLNSNIYDFLLKLPGITSRNIARIMTKVKKMKELIKYDIQQFAELLGSEANAKLPWEIIHVAHKPVEADANEKQFWSKF